METGAGPGGDVNVIDGWRNRRETHSLEGDVTQSRAGRRCKGRRCYHIELSWRLAFSAFACSWSLGGWVWAPIYMFAFSERYICLNTSHCSKAGVLL